MPLSNEKKQELWMKVHEAATRLATVARNLEGAQMDTLAGDADKLSNDVIIFAAKLNPIRKPPEPGKNNL